MHPTSASPPSYSPRTAPSASASDSPVPSAPTPVLSETKEVVQAHSSLMPARHDPVAPVFDPRTPEELPKFLSDLIFLLDAARVTSAVERKRHCTRYLSLADQELWELLPEFSDPTASFSAFCAAVHTLYPEASPRNRHSYAKLDSLVSVFAAETSPSRAEFFAFFREFLRISESLLAQSHISPLDQRRAFERAIPAAIRDAVHGRLYLLDPHAHPEDVHSLQALREAIDFVLVQRDAKLRSAPLQTAPVRTASPMAQLASAAQLLPDPFRMKQPSVPGSETQPSTLKPTAAWCSLRSEPSPDDQPDSGLPEPIQPVSTRSQLEQLTSAVQTLTEVYHAAQKPLLDSAPPTPSPRPTPSACSYCSDKAHWIRRCPAILADIASGICIRNADERIVMPDGRYVPHSITGPNLRARILAYHGFLLAQSPATT
ncbi:hypothetical protein MKEN_01203400 [Mycena kentingensis (nom. inval.)]|nr:hypothetical protein MKEN_01203400 [Mycena kentingensis (nom. inval.)]